MVVIPSSVSSGDGEINSLTGDNLAHVGLSFWKGILLAEKAFPGGERGKVSMNVMIPSGETWCSSHGTVVFDTANTTRSVVRVRRQFRVYPIITAF